MYAEREEQLLMSGDTFGMRNVEDYQAKARRNNNRRYNRGRRNYNGGGY